MFWAISATAAAFCSLFMSLLRGTYGRTGPRSTENRGRLGRGLRLLLRTCAGRVDLDAGAHRAGQRDRLEVTALRARGLRADDLLEQRRVVLQQGLLVEARLADRQVDVCRAVRAVLDLAGLGLLDRLG